MTLIRQHARNEAVSTLIWALVLGLVGFITTYLWEVVHSSGAMAELEKALANAQGVVKGLIGGAESMLSLDGWIQGYALGTVSSIMLVIFTALFVAGMVTREMDRRTMEFVLSLPVTRAHFLLARWSVLAGSLVLLHLAQFIGVVSGVAATGQEGHPGRYALALLNSLLLHLFLGTLMLLISLFIDDYGPGSGVLLGLGLGLTFLHMGTADATGALKRLREALPFSWYDIQSIVLKGNLPWGDLILLAGGTAVLLALAVWLFQRKQIAV